MSDPSPGPFRVVYSGAILEQIRALAVRAAARDRGNEFALNPRMMQTQLTADPQNWGDPVYNLRHLNWTVYDRAYGMLAIRYAVDPVERVVHVVKVQPLATHPFGRDPGQP
jgi:hypothetical protein